jgi:hypothetical protein
LISILHPSRSRPEKSYKTARKWLDNAGCNCEYILSLDHDDPKLLEYNNTIGVCFEHKNRSAIEAINNAAKVATGNILIVISDDFDCPPLWGKKILDIVQGREDWIMKTYDGIQPRLITLPIMDRKYYQRFGYIYFPEYKHMYADKELTEVAHTLGRVIETDLQFTHKHYSVTDGVRDEVSIRADATVEEGKKLYFERKAYNFYL